jgi:hypothetical protein
MGNVWECKGKTPIFSKWERTMHFELGFRRTPQTFGQGVHNQILFNSSYFKHFEKIMLNIAR